MLELPYIQTLIKRLKEPRSFIQVLFGPRQVGKTTLTRQLLQKVRYPHLYASADGMANAGEFWLEQQLERDG